MTLEELQVRFTADIAPLSERLSALGDLLSAAGAGAEQLVSRFHGAGGSAGDGLASGIASRKSAVVSAARAVALAASEALRGALSIHSPSKVTLQSGERFTEGFTRGIEGGAMGVRRAVERLGDAAVSSLPAVAASAAPSQTAIASPALDRVSLTVPLYIDGYKLGVAAIDGINRVSRSTGGVELTL